MMSAPCGADHDFSIEINTTTAPGVTMSVTSVTLVTWACLGGFVTSHCLLYEGCMIAYYVGFVKKT